MKKIMIVDDDQHISDMLVENLSTEGYEVVAAYSGTEALLLLSGTRPDLILLDLMLPGISGEELITKIKALAEEYGIIVKYNAYKEKMDEIF